MCHETTARPPLPPIAGGSGGASSGRLVLDAADGNRFRAFPATANDPEAAGIVTLPDVRGLHPFYEDLAVRFAEAGIHAMAMDYFGRTAGIGERDEDFDFMAHVPQVTTECCGRTWPRRSRNSDPRPGEPQNAFSPFGFCRAARFSFNQAAD